MLSSDYQYKKTEAIVMEVKKDKTIQYVEDFINNDYSLLKENLESLVKEYQRKSRRLDKIIKQSDKQQRVQVELNDTIMAQKEQLDKLYNYNTQQENIAKQKLDLTIINTLKNDTNYKTDIVFKASDILSGDFYSIHTLEDGSTLAYILDGQGHGISPALTIFAVSSTIVSLIHVVSNFEELIEKLFPMIQKFLGDIEQLSYTMVNILPDRDKLSYVSGGTYPLLLQCGDEIQKHKANNLPFMNFSLTPNIKTLNCSWEKLLLYTDGLVEDIDEDLSLYTPQIILDDNFKLEEAREIIDKNSYEDDITIIKICKTKV